MKYPNCNGDIEKGFLNSQRLLGVGWSKKKLFMRLFGEKMLFEGSHEAFRCEKCKIVVFHYED